MVKLQLKAKITKTKTKVIAKSLNWQNVSKQQKLAKCSSKGK